jgi:hypothetical protein
MTGIPATGEDTMLDSQRNAEIAARNRLLIVCVLSLAALVVAMIWTWRIGQESNRIAHRLAHMQEGLDDLKRLVKKSEAHLP